MKKVKILYLAVLTGSLSVCAEVRLPNIFSDNMVLQADLPAKIWGWQREPTPQVRRQIKNTRKD